VPAHLVDAPLDVARLAREVAGPDHGAGVSFVGTVRDHHQGRPVRAILYTAYAAMAESRLGRIELEIGQLHGVRIRIQHRLGELPAGEASIAIAVSAPHRAAAYDANRLALERVKREVPIWTRELYADGDASWREIEPLRETDAAPHPAPAATD
jgi:molybdopterin synthase catalytic subunit